MRRKRNSRRPVALALVRVPDAAAAVSADSVGLSACGHGLVAVVASPAVLPAQRLHEPAGRTGPPKGWTLDPIGAMVLPLETHTELANDL